MAARSRGELQVETRCSEAILRRLAETKVLQNLVDVRSLIDQGPHFNMQWVSFDRVSLIASDYSRVGSIKVSGCKTNVPLFRIVVQSFRMKISMSEP